MKDEIGCCDAWHSCWVVGRCVNPYLLDRYVCAAERRMASGVNLKRGELLLVDGNALLHRCFHAFPPMSSPDGLPTNAVYGMLKMLEGLVSELKPTHLAVCFDASKHTWRHQLYDQYKANRKPAPELLAKQFTIIREVLSALNIPYYEDTEYEADDLLGTIAQKAGGYLTRIATGDRDCLQLVSPRVKLVMYKNNSGHQEMDLQTVKDSYGLEPWQLVHYKALAGDSSDNIPGVPGIGEKTALELLKQFSSINEIAEGIEKIPGRPGKLLASGLDSMKLSYKLAKINCEAPVDVDFDALKMVVNIDDGQKMLANLGIKKINLEVFVREEEEPQAPVSMPSTDKLVQKTASQKQSNNVEQLALF